MLDFLLRSFSHYNPDGGSTFVDKRLGLGFSINMASKAGKFLTGFVVLSILSIPVVCLWFILEEMTPINLTLTDHQIIAEQKKNYIIDISVIQKVSLLGDIPKADRIMGTALSNLDKGTFEVAGYGKCINPQNNYYILIKRAEKTYLFSDVDDTGTRDIYKKLREEP